jgi:membrane protease YdiL (CAAX protease family)
MTGYGRRLLLLIETGLVILFRSSSRDWVHAAAVAAGITLPMLPLLRDAYIFFGVALLVLVWLKLRGESWASIGLVRPKSWWAQIGWGLLLFLVILIYSVLAQSTINQTVAEWTGTSPSLAEETFASIEGNTPLFLMILPLIWIFAAFGEEVFYRGYIMTRFHQVLGEGRLAWIGAIIAQAVLFGLAHAYQGPVGMVGTGLLGVFFGAGALIWGRNLLPAMIAHGLADTLGFTLLYFGVYGS